MRKQAFQPGEIRDEQNNIIRPGAYGKNSAFATAANDGILDYIINNFDALYDTLTGGMLYVDSLPEAGDASKLYVIKSTGKCYRYDGTKFVLMDGAAVDFISSAKLAEDGTMTLTTAAGRSLSVTLDPVNAIADKAQKSADAAKASETASATSEANAKKSETNAAKSEASASTAATAANDSQTAALASQNAAAVSETNAKASADAALSSANEAKNAASQVKTDLGATNINAAQSSENTARTAKDAQTATNAAAKAQEAAEACKSALQSISSVARYKGSVENYADLATACPHPETGDIFNIANGDAEHNITAGDNVIWNGTEWDNLSGFTNAGVTSLDGYDGKITGSSAVITGNVSAGSFTTTGKVEAQAVTINGAEAMTKTNADTVYLAKTDAQKTYLTKTDADSTYATKVYVQNIGFITSDEAAAIFVSKHDAESYAKTADVAGTYVTKSDAEAYAKTTDVSATYLTKTDAESTYAKKTDTPAVFTSDGALKFPDGTLFYPNGMPG